MRTYYYMACDDHMEITDAASDKAEGCFHMGNSEDTLLPFIIYHAGCKVRIISEHQNESWNFTYREWTTENAEEMSDASRKQEIHAASTSYEDNL